MISSLEELAIYSGKLRVTNLIIFQRGGSGTTLHKTTRFIARWDQDLGDCGGPAWKQVGDPTELDEQDRLGAGEGI